MTRTRISLVAAAFIAACAWFAPIAQAATVAQYLLDGNANDSSGNGFHGVATDVNYVFDADRGMNVASFNGSSSSIDVSSSNYSVTEQPNGQFSISFWVKPTPRQDYAPGGAIDVNVLMGGSSRGVIEIVGDQSWNGMDGINGGVGVNSGGGGGSSGRVSGIDIYDGDWHHVVIQWLDPDGSVAGNDSADADIWIDAIMTDDENSGAYNGNGAASPMVLGGPVVWSAGGSPVHYYDGLMSDVRFFDTQLSQSEVDALFNDSVVPEPSSVALMLLGGLGGLGALVALRRRKSQEPVS